MPLQVIVSFLAMETQTQGATGLCELFLLTVPVEQVDICNIKTVLTIYPRYLRTIAIALMLSNVGERVAEDKAQDVIVIVPMIHAPIQNENKWKNRPGRLRPISEIAMERRPLAAAVSVLTRKH